MAQQDHADRYLAETLHALARQLRDKPDAHTADKAPDDVVPISYALGLRDAALILTTKADEHHIIPDPPEPQRMSDFAPWDGDTYDGPSVLSRVHIPGIGDFLTHLPQPIEYRHTDDGNIERVTPPATDWVPTPNPTTHRELWEGNWTDPGTTVPKPDHIETTNKMTPHTHHHLMTYGDGTATSEGPPTYEGPIGPNLD